MLSAFVVLGDAIKVLCLTDLSVRCLIAYSRRYTHGSFPGGQIQEEIPYHSVSNERQDSLGILLVT